MPVAEAFDPKTEIISDLRIDPTAAYLLAAPSAPDEARERAIREAEEGKHVTTKVARGILAEVRGTAEHKPRPIPPEKLRARLLEALERFKEQWDPKEVSDLARELREFAGSLDEGGGGRKRRPRKKPS